MQFFSLIFFMVMSWKRRRDGKSCSFKARSIPGVSLRPASHAKSREPVEAGISVWRSYITHPVLHAACDLDRGRFFFSDSSAEQLFADNVVAAHRGHCERRWPAQGGTQGSRSPFLSLQIPFSVPHQEEARRLRRFIKHLVF